MQVNLDLKNRLDAFMGSSERDGGKLYLPLCLKCKNKIDLHICTKYNKGIPIPIIVGDTVCQDFLSF